MTDRLKITNKMINKQISLKNIKDKEIDKIIFQELEQELKEIGEIGHEKHK